MIIHMTLTAMNKPADIGTILSIILLWLLIACSGPHKDAPQPLDNQISANESLKMELGAFDSFNKAEPFYRAGINGADSAACYYEQLLEENLTPDQRIFVVNRLGYVRFTYNNLIDSYAQFVKATGLAGQISPGCLQLAGIAFYYMGTIQCMLNQSDSALFYLLEAIRIFKGIKGGMQDYHYLCLEKVAYEYSWNLEDYARAEQYYVQAQELLDTGRIQNGKLKLCNLCYSMSSMYRQKREFDKALIYADRAKNLADSLKESRFMEISRALQSNIYRDMNRWELAKSLNNQAIEMNYSNGGRFIDLAIYFNSMTFILINLRQYPEALLYCNKVLRLLNRAQLDAGLTPDRQRGIRNHDDLTRVSAVAPDPSVLFDLHQELGICYDFRGTIYLETGNPDLAYQDYKESLRLRKIRYGNKHKRVAQINRLIGNYFLQLNSPDSALYHYQQSLIAGMEGFNNPDVLMNPSLIEIENNVELIEVLREKASLLTVKHSGDPGKRAILSGSLDCLKLCDSLIDYIWNSYTNEDSRLFLEDTVHSIYDQAIETAYQLYQYDSSATCLGDIFHFMENSRYRFLSDNLTSIQAYTRARIPENLVGRLREKDYYIKYFNRQKNEVPEKSDYYNKKLYEKIRQKDLLMDSMYRTYPEIAGIKSLLKSITLDSLKEKIRSKNDIIIQYFSGSRHFFILSTDGKKTGIRMVDKDPALLGSIEAILEIPDAASGDLSGYIRFARNSLNLYKKLLEPSLKEFNDSLTGSLVIIPDGSLNQISFDALIRSMPDTSIVNYQLPDYLVKHFAISYAFSSGILVADKQPVKSLKKSSVLALSYGNADDGSGPFVSLDGANKELDAIKGLFSGRYFKNREATESSFKKYAPEYQIIHLALHGQAGTGNNDSTMLIFRKADGDPDDGLLLPEELYSLNLNAQIVVLSSCESGIGKNFRGEGVYSMARAFANAGCPTLVTTLWQIPDINTVPLIAGFYGGLRKKLTPDQALRKSKTDYIVKAGPYASHPRFWASLIPVGEMRTMKLSGFRLFP